jgi:hypothetical protein
LAILVAAVKYSFIAALLIFILITLLWGYFTPPWSLSWWL